MPGKIVQKVPNFLSMSLIHEFCRADYGIFVASKKSCFQKEIKQKLKIRPSEKV